MAGKHKPGVPPIAVPTTAFPAVEIGTEVRPPTVVAPDPGTLFTRRARRFHDLAKAHPLAPWLSFLGDLSAVQNAIQAGLPEPAIPEADSIARSIEFGMPVLPRMPFTPDAAVTETISRLLDHAVSITMPEPARAALNRLRTIRPGNPTQPPTTPGSGEGVIPRDNLSDLRSAEELTIAGCVEAVLSEAIPVETIAEHVFVGAALQVHFARAAALLDAARLNFIGDGVCPICGAPPATSGIVGWGGADRTRFCTCSLCGSRWNAVRVKCLTCSSTKGIHYQSIKGLTDTIKAECCDECRTFVKIMAEDEDPAHEPIADDVASLGLDLLVLKSGYRRAGMNLFLLGI